MCIDPIQSPYNNESIATKTDPLRLLCIKERDSGITSKDHQISEWQNYVMASYLIECPNIYNMGLSRRDVHIGFCLELGSILLNLLQESAWLYKYNKYIITTIMHNYSCNKYM